MKKLLLASAVMLLAWSIVHARMISGLPRGEQNTLATADYGGVLVSTSAFSSEYSTASYSAGVFYGVIFSSGSSADFVDVYDSTRVAINGGQITRLYNTAYSTGGVNANTAGFVGPTKPIRFGKGLIYKPSVAVYNVISVLYNEDELSR